MGRSKAMIIGWDGATWRLLEPWIEAGKLPNLRRMVNEGVAAPLKSTIRPESSVAWTTFATGASPGQHGVYGFVQQIPGSYGTRMNTSRDVHIPRFWDVAGQSGLEVAIINVPMTYPPAPVNGFIISGMPTPTPEPAAFPPQIQEEIRALFPGYKVQEEELGDDPLALLGEVERTTAARADAILHYMKNAEWDLFVGVFTATDRLQHFFWHYLDPSHPRHEKDPRVEKRLMAIYQLLDDVLGEAMETAGKTGAPLWLVSDHGFNGCDRAFSPNLWLEQEGFLKRKAAPSPSTIRSKVLNGLRHTRFLRKLKQRLPVLRSLHMGRKAYRAPLADRIDWSETVAYFSEDGGIRLNLRGREPDGIVPPDRYETMLDDLEERLLAVRDPVTGMSPVAQVFRKGRLYRGPYADQAPDLIIEPRRSGSPEGNTILLPGFPALRSPFTSSGKYTGNHEIPGVLVIWGEGVRSGKTLSSARLEDVAPTVCRQLGLICPPQSDGKVLMEAFPKELSDRVSPRPYDSANPTHEPQALSEEEEARMREYLRGLGYVE